ncbi:alpha/beta fold hydrolase [Naasia sp. SYSU D00057]|uniref:alpha/beta fold hydrolase n=1 Tax=Naasia sp. SYSU D00057 TaxID=2817380 RepID=UPI001B3116B9|nr:alpha/beta hydrolase [Naasia sp. SYSU D00057]
MNSGPRARRRRPLRTLGIAALAALALLLVSAAANAVLTGVERASTPPYGERVAVGDGHLNVHRQGAEGQTLVLLTGYATAAPALDFAPLIRELDGYRIVVVEGFGYGYSDTEAPPRTIDNITRELHEALAASGVDAPYVLVGHSIAGIYELYYANRYRDEVAAVVGIDASVPGQINGLAGQDSPLNRLLPASGLLRVASFVAPSFFDPEGTAFTDGELDRMRLMANWNSANPAVLDEANHGEQNFAAVEELTFPADLPVLSFIKRTGSQEGWRELHERQLEDLEHGELVVLDGGHYLHHTLAPEIAAAITRFLGETTTSP